MKVFGVRRYQPSARRVYQPAALPEREPVNRPGSGEEVKPR